MSPWLTRSQASQSPEHLIVTGRNPAKLQECVDALKAKYPDVDCRTLRMDLSSQKDVRAAAAEFLSWTGVPKLNILINSAGVGQLRERTLSEDGIEMHLATNHLGHFLFTNLVLPKLVKASEAGPKGATRVVNVSAGSVFHTGMRFSDMFFEKKNKDLPDEERPDEEVFAMWGYSDIGEKTYLALDGYNRSKAANVLFGIGANRRWYDKHGIVSLAVHPGVIETELVRNFPAESLKAIGWKSDNRKYTLKTQGAGASTSLVAALDPKLGEGLGQTVNGKENYGAMLEDCQITEKAHPLAVSSEHAERLWKVSEELVKQEFN